MACIRIAPVGPPALLADWSSWAKRSSTTLRIPMLISLDGNSLGIESIGGASWRERLEEPFGLGGGA